MILHIATKTYCILLCNYILGICVLNFTNGISFCGNKTLDLGPWTKVGNLTYLEIHCPCNEKFIIDLYRGDRTIACNSVDSYHGERIHWFGPKKCQMNSKGNTCSFTYKSLLTSERFYCATMRLTKCYGITYYTNTIQIEDNFQVQTLSTKAIPNYVWAFAGISIVIVVTGLAIVFHSGFGRQVKWHPSANPNENRHLLRSLLVPLESSSKCRNLFVLYYNDNAAHFKAVQQFMLLLQDILHWNVTADFNCMTDICTYGLVPWTSQTIEGCDKIVVISSEGAFNQIASYQKTKKFPNTTTVLGNALLYTWHNITSNHSLSQNYNKLFNVRFSYTSSVFLTPEVVVSRHFVIPEHLSELMYHLLDSSEEPELFSSSLHNELSSMPLYKDFIKAVSSITDCKDI